MSAYPRYFIYGTQYYAPAPYVRSQDDTHSTIVDPGGLDLHTSTCIDQWLDRVRQGVMAEISKEQMAAYIEAWNNTHPQQLRLPD